MAEGSDLMMFYGTECEHCHEMEPLLEKLEKEEGIAVNKLEVWHDNGNMSLFEKYDSGKCGSVPFFYNKKSGKWICGLADYDKLKEWAKS
jgi:thiol-disulfide isomerase/thioredoxin